MSTLKGRLPNTDMSSLFFPSSKVPFTRICGVSRLNTLPGLMRRFDTDEAGAIAAIAKGNRHRRLLEVDETTAAAMYLCSDGARSINGQTIEISGGQV